MLKFQIKHNSCIAENIQIKTEQSSSKVLICDEKKQLTTLPSNNNIDWSNAITYSSPFLSDVPLISVSVLSNLHSQPAVPE